METLANAAYLTSPDQSYSAAFSHGDMHPLSALHMGGRHGGGGLMHGGNMAQSISPAVMATAMPGMASMSGHFPLPGQQLHGPGRHLHIMDHTVHRIDDIKKPNGEQEKEWVVSNLRHFNLRIGVQDPRHGVGREDLPLKAELLYENGQLVEQLATCEPLLVGKTEVCAMQAVATFKLRITSLSSHRDKQRFRIRVSPVDTGLLLHEPGLSVVTTPMKCVTKLTHRSSVGPKLETEDEDDEADGGEESACSEQKKRKRDDVDSQLEAQREQIESLQQTSDDILGRVRGLKQLLTQALAGLEGGARA